MTEQTFDGRVAVITGAASGIGNAVAHHFAERGATVVAVDRSPSTQDAVDALPAPGGGRVPSGAGATGTGRHLALVADLLAPGTAASIAAAVHERYGRLDVLVNSAGIALLSPAIDTSDSDWDATLAVNLTASFRMAQAVAPGMIGAGYGRIVNLASQASVVGLDQHAAYCASKAGLLGLTRVLSLEWARHGVTVNAVSPTVVETPLGKKAWAGEKGDALKAQIPARRFAQPEEVAALIGYLASEQAGMVTGENILIDGGYASI